MTGADRLGFVSRDRCPACLGQQGRVIYECPFDAEPVRTYLERFYGGRIPIQSLAGHRYLLAECHDCGMVWQVQVLDGAGMALLYGQWIEADFAHSKSLEKVVGTPLLYVHQVYQLRGLWNAPPPETTVLDFGCGWGAFLLMARAFGYKVVGVELEDEARAHLISQGIPCYATVEEVPEKVEIIYSHRVFEHIPDPRDTLIRLASACRPGGVIWISVPNPRGVLRVLKREGFVTHDGGVNMRLNAIAPLEHINGWVPGSMARMGKLLGLEVVSPPHRDVSDTSSIKRGLRVLAKTARRAVLRRLMPRRHAGACFRVPPGWRPPKHISGSKGLGAQ